MILAVSVGTIALGACRWCILDTRHRPAAASAITRDADVITAQELADPSVSGDNALDAVRRLRPRFLASRGGRASTGVKTVRDIGTGNYADIALHNSINKGVMIGPRMYVAGYGFPR